MLMTHGLIHSIQSNPLLMQPTRSYSSRHVYTTSPAEEVITVGVRLRQQDAGHLYEQHAGVKAVPLDTYQAGEMLDFYA
ncbi:hypothetical protein ACFL6U_11200 [Planctomycetota bacterium]